VKTKAIGLALRDKALLCSMQAIKFSCEHMLQAERWCFACGEKGYFTNRCPNLLTRDNQTTITTPAPTHGANSVPVAAKQNYVRGKVNHIVVEEA
jgi:hypothetical protein